MPKAKWGAGDDALTAADIDGADRSETRKRYSGELPRGGTYRFIIQSIKQAESKTGNPKALIFATLDGSWQPNHAQYDGCPLWDHMPVMKSTAERVANFMDALGGSGKDLFNAITDENGYITKLGSVGDPKDLMVYINVKKDKQDGYDESLKVDYNGYIAVDDDDSAAAGADNGEPAPF
jgi:hypothetical protein